MSFRRHRPVPVLSQCHNIRLSVLSLSRPCRCISRRSLSFALSRPPLASSYRRVRHPRHLTTFVISSPSVLLSCPPLSLVLQQLWVSVRRRCWEGKTKRKKLIRRVLESVLSIIDQISGCNPTFLRTPKYHVISPGFSDPPFLASHCVISGDPQMAVLCDSTPERQVFHPLCLGRVRIGHPCSPARWWYCSWADSVLAAPAPPIYVCLSSFVAFDPT